MPAAIRFAPVATDRGGSARSLLVASALQALDYALRGGANRPLARCLQGIRLALQHKSVPAAIRLIDRAWRTFPGDTEALAPIYGRLLSLEDREHDAVLRLLQQIDVRDADVAALTTRAYLRLLRTEDAKRYLDLALRECSMAPGGLLAQEASDALQIPDLQVTGWVGLGPTLEFHGELAAGAFADSLQIRLGDETLPPPRKTVQRDGRTLFSFQAPQTAGGTLLHMSSAGVALLGSPRRLPLEFGLDGRAGVDGDRICGWARLGWLPAQPVQLCFEDEDGHRHRLRTKGSVRPGYRWPFRLDAQGVGLTGSRLHITAQLPDGRWQPLPDTPLLLDRALRFKGLKRVRLPRWRKQSSPVKGLRPHSSRRAAPIDVLIPVYGGGQETLACIESVLASVADLARVIVVDDATEDAALAAALDELAAAGRITLLRNERNLGFVNSVNRVLALQSTHDIVLLNSDTLVFADWLQRLSAAAYSGSRVGTVTPLSNNGSIASYPRAFGSSLDPEQAAALDKLAAWTHPGTSIEVPVGVGFCLYLRADCLRDIGELDAAVFGVGYGEESDFCMRARQRGWSHRIAADVFVYHASAHSFGARRAALMDRSNRLLNLRYPGYDRYIADFIAQDPLHPLRRRLDERRLSSFDGRFVLLVTLALEGGVERFVTERGRQIRERGLFPLVLKARKPGDARRCELSTEAIDVPNLRYEIPAELSDLSSLLSCLRIDEIEIQHFLDLDARVIDTVRALGVPYDVMVHDYSWICPRVTLIDGSGRYCHEPAVSVCRSCVRKNGSRLGETISVPALRARSAAWLGEARRVLAPSADTAARLNKYFPALPIEVRPHTPPLTLPPQRAGLPRPKRLRVGLIGAIGDHKGYQVLLDCARDAAARRLPVEFVVIGFTQNDKPLLKTGKVSITGRYGEIEAPHLLRRERPDIVFLPSVWPETWCYTLDYAMAAGLPVVSFDLGAIAERLRAAGHGILLPLDLSSRQINDHLLGRVAGHRNRAPYVQKPQSLKHADAKIAKIMEKGTMKPSVGESSPEEGLSASVQVLPLPTGLYLFSVKAAAALAERGAGQLSLPAMHVGLGPGVPSDQVEFIAGPGSAGTWLFAHGDVLVVKVNGAGATLILTSVRSSVGEVLSIEVERLEARAEASVPTEGANISGKLPPAGSRTADAQAAVGLKSKSAGPVDETLPLPLQIKTHIRSRGDVNFADVPWAGRVAAGLWIESFSVQPLRHLGAHHIEYKALTGTGFETPWLSDDQICGTKGMSVPLVGFAVRLKPSSETSSYDCEYSGYYRSSVIVGPLRNGAPCRSTVANDPLEGIQIRIVKRPSTAAANAGATGSIEPQHPGIKAPSFGRYRDTEAGSVNGDPKTSASPSKPAKRTKSADAAGKSDRTARSANRSPNRLS
jgi:GT2 family glycosyltransferase/glycosyltransferase involved in cell wall biosynthesis